MSDNQTAPRGCVLVVRHGERLDYVMRDSGKNWIPTAERPWDPPLTSNGESQARKLGEYLPRLLASSNLSPVTRVYSSPLTRCCQTASQVIAGIDPKSPLRIGIECGLTESMNADWYASWCLPGSDSTWGYRPGTNDGETIHPMAKKPVRDLLPSPFEIMELTENELPVDTDYKTLFVPDSCYRWGNYESGSDQRERMGTFVRNIARMHPDETVLVVSHGGPVTHLFETLTNRSWDDHGLSQYTGWSLYLHQNGGENWDAIRVNDISHLD